MSSLLIANSTFERIVQEIPAEVEMLAREFGAFSRSRAVRNPKELLRAVLMYGATDQSLREVAANFTQNGRRLSDEAVRWRLSTCGPWLQAMIEAMMPKAEDIAGASSMRLKIVDSTTVEARGAVTTDYRVHLGWNHSEQRLSDLLLTDNKTGESLKLFDWQEGDVVLADAGYAKAGQMAHVKASGADYVVRCAPKQIALYLPGGERLNVVKELQRSKGKMTVSMNVLLGLKDGERQSGWLHAFRLPEKDAQQARRRVKKRAQKKYKGIINEETLYLAGWMLILTSFPPEKVPAEIVGRLYRGRWQIEIVIKRLKSVLDLDALRARRGSRLARVYLLAKLLYSLMIERRTLGLKAAKDVGWRVWKLMARHIGTCIAFPTTANYEINKDVMKVLKERQRKRKLLRHHIDKSIRMMTVTYCEYNSLQP